MFGRKKGLEARSRSHDTFVICVHGIILAILMGAGINVGFIADTWFGPVFGSNVFLDLVVGIIFGGLIGYGSYGLFIRSERAIRAILKSDEHSWLKGFRIGALILLNLGFIGIGITGLIYRLQFIHTPGVKYLIIIGCILEASVPLFGLVLHPIQHPPAEVLEEERVQDFTTNHVGRMYDTFDELPIDEQHEVYTGIIHEDAEPILDVLDRQVQRSRSTVDLTGQNYPRKPRRYLTVPWKKKGQQGNGQSPKLSPLPTPTGNGQGSSRH